MHNKCKQNKELLLHKEIEIKPYKMFITEVRRNEVLNKADVDILDVINYCNQNYNVEYLSKEQSKKIYQFLI